MENEIKSVFDGWELQCYGDLSAVHEDGIARCAVGWLFHVGYRRAVRERISAYIQRHYDIPRDQWPDREDSVMIYANNVLKLTPEQFREADRRSQIAEALTALEAGLREDAIADGLPELLECAG